MKQMLAVITLVLAILLGGGLICAQGGDGGSGGGGGGGTTSVLPVANGETAARLFLERKIAYFMGAFDFNGVSPANDIKDIRGVFQFDLKGQVPYLAIDGNVIVDVARGDQPLTGLPCYTAGMCTNYSLWLEGYTANGEAAISGGFYTELLKPAQPIVVMLQPQWRQKFLPYDLALAGLNPDNARLRFGDGSIAYYDQVRGGFVFWYDALGGEVSWEIYDALTGIVYVRGVFEYGSGPSAQKPDSIVNFQYAGGVIDASLDTETYRTFDSQRFGSWVERDGQTVLSAVYMTDALGNAFGAWAFGLEQGSQVEVRQWVPEEQGEMPLLLTAKVNEYGFSNINLPAGFGRLVITVIGKSGPNGFYFSVQRGQGGKG